MKRILGIAVLAAIALIIGVAPHAITHVHAQQYAECVSIAAAPPCQSASYGIVTIAASAQTVVVNTTAVTATSPILLTYDGSTTLGTALGVTCNTTSQPLFVSARTAGSSFTIKAATGNFSTNPGCMSFHIIPQ